MSFGVSSWCDRAFRQLSNIFGPNSMSKDTGKTFGIWLIDFLYSSFDGFPNWFEHIWIFALYLTFRCNWQNAIHSIQYSKMKISILLKLRVLQRERICITIVWTSRERIRFADYLPPNRQSRRQFMRAYKHTLHYCCCNANAVFSNRLNFKSIVRCLENCCRQNAGIFKDWQGVGSRRWVIVWCQQTWRTCENATAVGRKIVSYSLGWPQRQFSDFNLIAQPTKARRWCCRATWSGCRSQGIVDWCRFTKFIALWTGE